MKAVISSIVAGKQDNASALWRVYLQFYAMAILTAVMTCILLWLNSPGQVPWLSHPTFAGKLKDYRGLPLFWKFEFGGDVLPTADMDKGRV